MNTTVIKPLASAVTQSLELSGRARAMNATDGASIPPSSVSAFATAAINALEESEKTSASALRGEVSSARVVDAVLKAEQTLQTTIAVRDKAVAAYLEISRMQI